MREIVILSGKGGTGKTSLTASFFSLAHEAVCADCDVDAADLRLVLNPRVVMKQDFYSGKQAAIRKDDCIRCGECMDLCRFGALSFEAEQHGDRCYTVDPFLCEGCGVCVRFCPEQAIDFHDRLCGEWYVSETRFGPLIHAKLGTAAENSGKLVSLVRREAKKIACEKNSGFILVDGPPGIGCPVIASMTGTDALVVVTEPSLSGEHDLKRILDLARHFGIAAYVCVNKWDVNPETTDRIEKGTIEAGAYYLGRIPWDSSVTKAQLRGMSVVEYGSGIAAESIKEVWESLCRSIV